MRGVILTHTNNLDTFVDALNDNQLGILKIVTGWPQWNEAMIRKVADVPRLIVRTKTGDGLQIDADTALAELAPFYKVRQDLLIEVGNEPNKVYATNDQIYEYRWHCVQIARRVLLTMPRARLIMPALIDNADMDRWYDILGDLVMSYNYIGLHVYEWSNFTPAGTDQLKRGLAAAERLRQKYGAKPSMITELGIHDVKLSPLSKARRYRAVMNTLPGNVAGTCVYHMCDQPSDQDQRDYALPRDALPYLR